MKRMVKALINTLLLTAMILALAACGSDKGDVVAEVGDRKIYIDDLTRFFDRSGLRFISSEKEIEAKRGYIDTLVNLNLLIIGAYEKNIDKDQEVLKVVEGEEIKFLLDILFEKEIIDKAKPSEAEMKDWFAKSGEEIKASHILVKTEDEAHEILAQLKNNANFEELAVAHSIDPTAQRNQGDLGYFTWGMMVDNFQDAAYALQPGQISAPVKTDFGYHIIKVVDRRKVERMPAYSEVKEQIRTSIIERRKRDLMKAYVDKLREKYPVTIEKPSCQFLLNKLEFLYPDSIGNMPRWRNNIDPQQLDTDEKGLVIGKYEGGEITIGEYLANLRRVPEDRRPDFDNYDSLSSVVFQMALMDILAIDARAQGLHNTDKYKNIITRFREHAMADIMRNDTLANLAEVDEGEVQEYYDTHQEEFTNPLRFHLIELQVASEKEALRYRGQIKSETQFKNIAAQNTMRPGMRQRSGDLGIITREEYPGLFDIAARTTGQLTKPVSIGNKWSIAWIKQRLEPELRPFEQCTYEINNKLLQQKSEQIFNDWLADMKKRINIEIHEDVLKNSIDYDKYENRADTTQAG